MKPILVGDCSNYSYDTNNCTKCGRSMPDLCVEFEDMKRKAEAYDQINRDSSPPSDTNISNKRTTGLPLPSDSIGTSRSDSTEAAYQAAADELVVELQYAKETKAAPVDPYVKKAATRKGRPPKAKQ